MLIGGIEAGGTKFICGVGDQNGNIIEKITIPTTTPKDTLIQVLKYFKDKNIMSLGVASFGPIDLIKSSKTYGFITKTPKKGWADFNLLGVLNSLNVPIAFDTDVNAAALAEYLWGAGIGLNNIVYLTIGTGVGGGAVLAGKPLQGLMHSEMGHMHVKRLPSDPFKGNCPFHDDCLEGLISGPAIFSRTGIYAHELPANHPEWQRVAYYLAQGLVNIIMILSPGKIILGGGVMQQTHLFPMIARHVSEIQKGYIVHDMLSHLGDYIVPPGLLTDSGLKGSIALAISAFSSK